MQIIRNIKKMQAYSLGAKRTGHSLAFVPTMGALHEGHLSLVRRAKKAGDVVAVSIYVNPTQFGQGEDLKKYPRPLNRDKRLLEQLDVDCLFLPSDSVMYPNDYQTFVEVEKITRGLEGESRPGHFKGVATIVAKLFNVVQPDFAIFGQKDAQQVAVIKRMVADLNFPLKIVVAPTVREKSGLAMSSRNRYFNEEQLARAACIYHGLKAGRALVKSGESSSRKVVSTIEKVIRSTKGTEIDYISVNDAETLGKKAKIDRAVLISVAVRLDGVRLIDNIRVRPA